MNNAKRLRPAQDTQPAELDGAATRRGATNARFLAALGEGQPDLPDPATLESIVLPSVHDGQRAPALRFGEPRTMALLGSIAAFAHVIGGLTNKSLRTQMVAHWREDYSSAQASYDLRRLRLKGLIERIDGIEHLPRHRPRPTHRCLHHPTRHPRRSFPPSRDLADLTRPSSTSTRPLAAAWRTYERELDLLRPQEPASPLDPKLASIVQNPTVKWI